ncbi:hypothetical protein VNI00_017239 [Paramarasmius palmivorus]|uniref:Uncharacterized protein n=1 Tax=Paramarasmius palmivorus TaxID=297713 RepID=A0AAW0B6R7_9AGAR
MSGNIPRRIVVDDTDARIEYAGSWFLDNTGFLDSLSCTGATYNRTMHGTKRDGATFSFTFEGEYVSIWGTKDTRNLKRNNANSIKDDLSKLPWWQCQIDGFRIPRGDYLPEIDRLTNNMLCDASGLSTSSPHVLTLKVEIDDPQMQTFWLDKIEYAPVPDADVSGEVLRVDSSDPSVRYNNTSRNWHPDTGTGTQFNQTGVTGTSLSFTFNGTSVSLYGFNEGDTGKRSATSGRYFIDNSNDVGFDIPGSKTSPSNSSRGIDYYNELFFQSPELKPGTHDMTITFTGPSSGQVQWLSVDYFYVTANEGTRATVNPLDSGNSNHTDGDSSGNDDIGVKNGGSEPGGGSMPPGSTTRPVKSPIGGIVGGIVGGTAFLGLLAFIFLKYRKKIKGAKRDTRHFADSIPFLARNSSGLSPYPYVTPSIFDPRSSRIAPPPAPVLAQDTADMESSDLPIYTLFASSNSSQEGRNGKIPLNQNHDGMRYSQIRMTEPPPDYTVE